MEDLEFSVTLKWISDRGPVQVPNRSQAAEKIASAVAAAESRTSQRVVLQAGGDEGQFEVDGLAIVKAFLGTLYPEGVRTQGHRIAMNVMENESQGHKTEET